MGNITGSPTNLGLSKSDAHPLRPRSSRRLGEWSENGSCFSGSVSGFLQCGAPRYLSWFITPTSILYGRYGYRSKFVHTLIIR